jgi:dihydroorotate dehydrogenase (NAD+) catalytic subunit
MVSSWTTIDSRLSQQMIELAPHHKIGLSVCCPLMPAAGYFGYGAEYAGLIDASRLGAIVTNPVSLRPKRGAAQPRLVELSEGCILDVAGQNPGVRQVIRRYAGAWRRLGVPVIVHLAPDAPSDVARTARALATTGAVAGLEVGLPDGVVPAGAGDMVEAAREGELPVLACLPLTNRTDVAVACVEAGADALVVAAPPVAAAYHPSGRLVTGRLYGRLVHALVLPLLRQLRSAVSLPLVASGGVHDLAGVRAYLAAGAVAVQVDSAIFRDPSLLARLADELAASTGV